jgi:Tfp pilus assembly PilM family ATPase
VLENVKGRLELVTAGALPLGELGVMEDNEDKRLAIGEKLKELVRGARLRAPQRRIGLPDKDAEIRYLMVPPVPPWRLEMLAKYEVEERSDSDEPKTFDYRILDIPDTSGQYMVLVGSCTEAASQCLLDLGRKSRLGEVEVDLKPLALFNAYYHGHGFDPDKTVLVVDIGAEHVTVLLVKDGALYLARTLMGGGRRFTQILADDMRMTPLEADEIKKREAEIRFDLPPGGGTVRATRMFRGRTTMRRRISGRSKVEPIPGLADEPTKLMKKPDLDSLRLIEETPGEAAPGGEGKTDAGTHVSPAAPPETVAPQGSDQTPRETPLKDDLATRETDLTPSPISNATARHDAEATPRRSDEEGGENALAPDETPETPAEKRKRQMSMSLVREAAALCAAMENVVSYCRQQNKIRDLKVEKVYLTGAGSRLKGLQTFVSRRMRVPVEPLEVFRNVSMDRLAPDAAQALEAEQDTMAVSMGLALSGLRKGAFSFLLWPASLKEKKEFRARGAFLHYAAALLLAVVGLAWITPKHNIEVYAKNYRTAEEAVVEALKEKAELDLLIKEHEELFLRLKQIERNAGSGHSLLHILAELKDPNRIPNSIYLTQFSTTLPNVIHVVAGGPAGEEASKEEGGGDPAAAGDSDAPDTFTAQAKVYLRGFARGQRQTEQLDTIVGDRTKGPAFKPGFRDFLLPEPGEPDHPKNVFKDIRPLWLDQEPNIRGVFSLKEFVLEGFLEGTRDERKGGGKKEGSGDPKGKPRDRTPAGQTPPASPKGAQAVSTPKPKASVAPTPAVAVPADPQRPFASPKKKTNRSAEPRPTAPAAREKPAPRPKPGAAVPDRGAPKPGPTPQDGEFVLPGNMPKRKGP